MRWVWTDEEEFLRIPEVLWGSAATSHLDKKKKRQKQEGHGWRGQATRNCHITQVSRGLGSGPSAHSGSSRGLRPMNHSRFQLRPHPHSQERGHLERGASGSPWRREQGRVPS